MGLLANNKESASPSPQYSSYAYDAKKLKRTTDYTNPFAIRDWMQELDSPEFGSVTKEIADLRLHRKHMLGPTFRKFPSLRADLMETSSVKTEIPATNHVRDIVMHDAANVNGINAPGAVVNIESDDDEPTVGRPFQPYRDVVLSKPEGEFSMKQFLVSFINILVSFSEDLV